MIYIYDIFILTRLLLFVEYKYDLSCFTHKTARNVQ